jgi:hypothetical protein
VLIRALHFLGLESFSGMCNCLIDKTMHVVDSLFTNFGIINIYFSGAFGDLARARRMGEIVELLLKKPGYSVRLKS